ncbi:HNH endonuclease signature motif containing protein, partial [Glaciibacter psychrotolerans]
QWQAALDPDGVAPNEVEGEATSTISFGRFKDGVYPVRGGVTPDLYGIMNLTFDAFIAARKTPAFPTAAEQARDQARDDRSERDDRAEQDAHDDRSEQDSHDGPDGHDVYDEHLHDHDHDDHGQGSASAEVPLPGSAGHEFDDVDTRTAGEKRADILRGMFTQLAQADSTPSIGGAPPTVVVHVNVNDIEAGRGVGWIDGVDAPISLRTVDQMMCAGGTQTVLFGPNGEVLTLTDPQRLFNRAQRRAILARDGGCGVPGCDAPAQWLEFHHVIPWSTGGVTEVDNGVALCWRHHHTIETSGWEILMVNGRPQVKAPAWIDPTRTWRDANRHRTDTHRRD